MVRIGREYHPRERLVEAVTEYGAAITFIADWRAGMFSISIAEYRNLPNALMIMYRIYLQHITEEHKDQAK